MESIIEIKNIKKKFGNKIVFENFNCDIKRHAFVLIKGVSGAGKSTLLNIIGLLENIDSGEISILGKNVKPFTRASEKLLRFEIGYIFQNFALVENKTVLYNLNMAMEYLEKRIDKKVLIKEALQFVNLSGYENKNIYECSGGEQQRIAIARLFLKPCSIIIADEPTGSLDSKNADKIIDLLIEFHKKGKTIIIASHDSKFDKVANVIINL